MLSRFSHHTLYKMENGYMPPKQSINSYMAKQIVGFSIMDIKVWSGFVVMCEVSGVRRTYYATG